MQIVGFPMRRLIRYLNYVDRKCVGLKIRMYDHKGWVENFYFIFRNKRECSTVYEYQKHDLCKLSHLHTMQMQFFSQLQEVVHAFDDNGGTIFCQFFMKT